MWIKICGIRDASAARDAAARGASAIGVNFHPASPRAISPGAAAALVRSLPSALEPVGLFVNHTVDQVRAVIRPCGLRTIQLHGDEPLELLRELQEQEPGLRLIRACRMGPEGLFPVAAMLEECRRRGVALWACLVDSHAPGVYGGSGTAVAWERLAGQWRADWPPLILAGGLRPENVAEAIRTVRPWGVDVASGVESSPGCKDPLLVERFIDAARGAFAETSTDKMQGEHHHG